MHLVTRLVENILEALKRSVLLWKYLNGIWFQGIALEGEISDQKPSELAGMFLPLDNFNL